METIDGNSSLSEQESAIRLREAAGCELLGLLPLMDGSNTNGASFRNLAAGQCPPPISLTNTTLPPNRNLISCATIFVGGRLSQIRAFR